MVPFQNGNWILVISSVGVGLLGKQRNTSENWIYLESVWRIDHLKTTELQELLQGKKKGLSINDVWVEITGAEVYSLKEKPEWIPVKEPPERKSKTVR